MTTSPAAAPRAPEHSPAHSPAHSEVPAQAGGVLTVDLDAIVANWRTLVARMPAGKTCAGVVKADGYGLGAAQVVAALARAGCRTFFVAMPDEAAALRRALPRAVSDVTIYVLAGLVGDPALFVTHDLRPVISSPEQAAAWLAGAPGRPYAVHVDTGMNRLGLGAADVATWAPRLTPDIVLSHLACADEPDHPLNATQLERFRIARAAFPRAQASLANSSGHFLGPEYLFDLGRPGVALYGGNPLPGRPNPMQPVVRLGLRILQVRRIDTPGSVGYGATRSVPGGARLATVAAGYADGLLRSLGNSGWGTLGGVRVPVVGRVSMDLITFDVSNAPEAVARPGALIDVLDEHHTVDDAAAEAGTISYEILTGLSRRYARRYIGGGEA